MSHLNRSHLRSFTRIALMGVSMLLVAGSLSAQSFDAQPRKVKAQAYTLKAENQADGSILVTYELKVEPQIATIYRQGKAFSRFKNLEGFLTDGVKGFPETLSKQANLMVDPSQEYSLELVDSQFREVAFDHPYLPSRGTILRNQNPDQVPYEVAPESLRSGMRPAQVVEHGEGYFIRNVAGYNLRFAVTQVDNGARRANVYTKLVFKIKPTQVRASFDRNDPQSRKVVKEVYDVMQGMFLNAPTTGMSANRAPWPYEIGDKGEILVIHTSRDASAVQTYVNHKRQQGYTVTTQEVAAGTNVKTTVQNAYNANKNLLYVQLVGDWNDIKCDTTTSSGETAPIDNALGLVAGTDKYFDMIIGRFSGESLDQVKVQIDKAIAYETNGAQDWKKKGLGMASNEGAGQGDDGEADVAHEDIIKTNKLIANGKFTAVATAYDTSSKAPLSACVNPVNAGLGVINYTGHGIHDAWATTGMNITAVNSLNNGAKTPIIFSVACVVGQYNGRTCFAESWLRKNNGGAVTAVMSTIYQPWLPPMRGQDYMNDLMTGGYNYTNNPGDGTNTDHGKSTVGAVVMNALNLMLGESQDNDSVQTTQSWVIFGDAALKVAEGTTPPPTSPTITTQPAAVTVNAGQTATFSVVASGAAPLSYQWYKNSAIINGATSASYTTPATVLADNKASFTVTVSNSVGSVTSNAAVLTVLDNTSTTMNETEPNNSAAAANVAADNVNKIVGYIGSSTDNDYFKVNVGTARTLKIVMTGPTGSSYDYDLYFYDAAGKQLAAGEGATCSETVSWTNNRRATTTVTVAVKRYKGSSTTTPYNLAITR